MKAKNWFAGYVLRHKLTKQKVIVLYVSSDGMVTCRYLTGNGEYNSCTFYKKELEEIVENDSQCGFEGKRYSVRDNIGDNKNE